MFSFWLTGLPPSPNRGEGWHWSRKNREDDQWKQDSRRLAIDARNRSVGQQTPYDYAEVKLTFCFKTNRRRDLDNLVAGSKGIIDGLVGVLIVDDDWKHMRLVVEGTWHPKEGVAVSVTPSPAW